MGSAKVVSLRARPWKASQLCFEVGGIMGQFTAQLGALVTAFDFGTFYSGLGATAGGDASLLSFNSSAILTAAPVAASLLAALRAEPRAAALDKAIYARQNAYFAKYGNAGAIVSRVSASYGAGPTAKPQLLQNLSNLADQQATLLATAYTTDGRSADGSGNPVVVRTTTSSLTSKTTTKDASSSTGNERGNSTSSGSETSTGESNLEEIGVPDLAAATLGTPPAAGGPLTGATFTTGSPGFTVQESLQEGTSGGSSTQTGSSTNTGSSNEASTGQAYAVETENIVNTDYSYRVPYIESQAQNARAQISLIDQQFTQFMATQNLPKLATVFQNELNSIDLGVYQLQVAFLDTILLSPIAGTVTGIFKNPGDPVSAGEPIVRVEDNTTIYLLAALVYRGLIQVGSTVSVSTQLFDAPGTPTNVSGQVVAVRSRGDDDQWDVIVLCANQLVSGNPTFPSGYVFDYDNTTVSVT